MVTRKFTAALFLLLNLLAAQGMAKEVTWKIASLAPKGMGWALYSEKVAVPALSEASGGELRCKFFWGGIMGDDEDYIKKMRIGQLDGMICSAAGFAWACPEASVLSLPYLFNNWDELDYIRKAMFPVFDEYAERNGFKILYWIDQDFDQIYSTKSELACPADFAKTRFVAWVGPMEFAVLKHLGAVAVPINVPEVSPSIRQGIADSVFAPALWIIGTQTYQSLKYLNVTPIRYSPCGIIVTLKAWEKIPEQWKINIIKKRLGVMKDMCMMLRRDSSKSITAMENYGLERIETSPADLEKLKKATRPVWLELAGQEGMFPKELLDEVLFQLDNYRKAKQ